MRQAEPAGIVQASITASVRSHGDSHEHAPAETINELCTTELIHAGPTTAAQAA